ncbi:hypothetical protein CYMTET_12508 [Cymbomonas tetramitiformis]|uniref:Rab-GAP TBC domain-containing protein n=1 Tax=Cymbomonas tetramitiformis TaxID=36881 RepID=A0AAE0LBS3_9CHLO|nr:hypothetical protein CYMTET_12508 [Cymbomonas tetramitiformis]
MLFEANAPALKRHFDYLEAEDGFRFEEAILVEWIFSLYAKVLMLDVAARVWDNFFLEGEVFIYRTAVALLQIMEPSILNAPVEKVSRTLKHEIQHVEEITLFSAIAKVEVPREIKHHVRSAEHAFYSPHFKTEIALARGPANMSRSHTIN